MQCKRNTLQHADATRLDRTPTRLPDNGGRNGNRPPPTPTHKHKSGIKEQDVSVALACEQGECHKMFFV